MVRYNVTLCVEPTRMRVIVFQTAGRGRSLGLYCNKVI
jgi:hypothetical protein